MTMAVNEGPRKEGRCYFAWFQKAPTSKYYELSQTVKELAICAFLSNFVRHFSHAYLTIMIIYDMLIPNFDRPCRVSLSRSLFITVYNIILIDIHSLLYLFVWLIIYQSEGSFIMFYIKQISSLKALMDAVQCT